MAERFDYKRYLASREWALKREAVRQRSGNRCERCLAGPQDAVHHITYARVGNEELSDLMAICNACHDYLSAKSDRDPLMEAQQWNEKYADFREDWLAASKENSARGECACHRPGDMTGTVCETCLVTITFLTDIRVEADELERQAHKEFGIEDSR